MTSQELPLMRKATAVWLVENTSLTFEQIADFCGLHELEVQGIADGDVAAGIIGQNPIVSGQLSAEELKRCENNAGARLSLSKNSASNTARSNKKSGKYTPIARRQDKPDGIVFLLKYYPEVTNLQIRKLIGTTNKMIDCIRDRSHWNIKNIKPRDVVLLGLCSQSQFNAVMLGSQEEKKVEKPKKVVRKTVEKVIKEKVAKAVKKVKAAKIVKKIKAVKAVKKATKKTTKK